MLSAGRGRLRGALARLCREGVPAGAAADLEALTAAAEPSPLAALAARGRRAERLDAISGLPAQQRRLAGLVLVTGLPVREAARAGGLPPGHVYAALHRARRALATEPASGSGRARRVVDHGALRIRGAGTAPMTVARLRRVRRDLPRGRGVPIRSGASALLVGR